VFAFFRVSSAPVSDAEGLLNQAIMLLLESPARLRKTLFPSQGRTTRSLNGMTSAFCHPTVTKPLPIIRKFTLAFCFTRPIFRQYRNSK